MKTKRKTRILISLIIGILMISSSFLSVWAAESSKGSESAEAAQTAEEAAEAATGEQAAADSASAAVTGFHYEHDPMENPKAAQDIVVNPDAIYGYSPNPDSKRLGQYASADWTDPAVVAKGREEREEYHHGKDLL